MCLCWGRHRRACALWSSFTDSLCIFTFMPAPDLFVSLFLCVFNTDHMRLFSWIFAHESERMLNGIYIAPFKSCDSSECLTTFTRSYTAGREYRLSATLLGALTVHTPRADWKGQGWSADDLLGHVRWHCEKSKMVHSWTRWWVIGQIRNGGRLLCKTKSWYLH